MDSWSAATFDLGLEAINPSFDLVAFENVQNTYEAGRDIFVLYRLGHNFQPDSCDWIGLYRSGWLDINDYVTSQPAPVYVQDSRFTQTRSVLFKTDAIELTERDQFFQFLYICNGNHVVGVSPTFAVTHPIRHVDNVVLEQTIDDFAALVFVDAEEQNDAAALISSQQLEPVQFCETSSSQTHQGVLVVDEWFLDSESEDETGVCERADDDERSMALVPYEYEKKAVVPYQEPQFLAVTAYLPPSHLCPEAEHQSTDKKSENEYPEFLRTMMKKFVLTTLIPRQMNLIGGNFCLSCVFLGNQLRITSDEANRRTRENKSLQRQLTAAENRIILKDVLIDEISKHLKEAISENGKLLAFNDKKVTSYRTKHVVALRKENEKLKGKLSDYTFRVTGLANENKVLIHKKTVLERRVQSVNAKYRHMKNKVDLAKKELESVQADRQSQERQLDDIMYTLALHGFTHMLNSDGTTTGLNISVGKVFRLDGWHVAQSKRSAKQMALVTSQATKNQEMQSELTSVQTMLSDQKKQLASLSSKLKGEEDHSAHLASQLIMARQQVLCLQAQMQELTHKLTVSQQQTQHMQVKVTEEQEKVANLQIKKVREEDELRQHIHSLQNSFNTLTNIHNKCMKQKKPGHVTSVVQGTQVTQQMADAASLTDEVICTPPNPFSTTRCFSKGSPIITRQQDMLFPVSNKKSRPKAMTNVEKTESLHSVKDIHPKLMNNPSFMQNKIADHVTFIHRAWEKVSPIASSVMATMCNDPCQKTDPITDLSGAAAAVAPSSDKPLNSAKGKPRAHNNHTSLLFVDETVKPATTKRHHQNDQMLVEDLEEDQVFTKRQKEQKLCDPAIIKMGRALSPQTERMHAVPKTHNKSSAPRPFHIIRRTKPGQEAPGKDTSQKAEQSSRPKQHKH